MLRFSLAGLLALVSLSGAAVRPVPYAQDTVGFEAQLISGPAKGKAPALLMFPDWMGMTPHALADAQKVAKWGYTVMVADVYGKGRQPQSPAEAGKMSSALKGNTALLRLRAEAALAALKKQPGVDTTRIVIYGYCFGGGAALELARAGASVKGVVSIHGNLKTPNPADAKNIKGKVLVLHGGNDPYVSQDEVKGFMDEMRAADVDWQLTQYGGAVHGFTNPEAGSDPKQGVAYNPRATERVYRALKDFLAETL